MSAQPQRQGSRLSAGQAVFLLLSYATASMQAQGHTFCVGFAQELQDAFTAAGTTYANEDNFIQLKNGLYTNGTATGGGPFTYSSTGTGQLVVAGNAGATSCGSTGNDPTASLLDGVNARPVLEMHSAQSAITLSWLTIQNGESSSPGAGLRINTNPADQGWITVKNIVVRSNHSSSTVGGMLVQGNGGAFVSIYTSLIIDNSADLAFGAGNIVGNTGPSPVLFVNNTISHNTTAQAGAAGGMLFEGSGYLYVRNNIFWSNSNAGLQLNGSKIGLDANDYGTRTGVAPFYEDASLSVDPQFVNEPNRNLRLSAASPLFARAHLSDPDYDLDGNRFARTGRFDLGPYQRTLFSDGFDIAE